MTRDVVLLHGFTQTGASWGGIESELGAGWTVHAPDMAGHGDLPAAADPTFAGEAARIDAAAPRRFLLCGYSMGGRLALYYALHRPERVLGLVLVSASPGLPDAGDRAARRAADEALAVRFETEPFEDVLEDWGTQTLFADQPGPVAAAAAADRRRNRPEALAAALRGLGTGVMPPLWDRLVELAMPVTLLAGERDAKFVRIARAMREALPEAELVVVPGAGHAVHLERPDAVAAAIRATAPLDELP